MKKIIITGLTSLALCFLANLYASDTRITSMGDVSIAVSDMEKEALENPAKLVLIKQNTFLGTIGLESYSAKDNYSYTTFASSSTSKSNDKTDKLNSVSSLNFIMPISNINTGLKLGMDYRSNSSKYPHNSSNTSSPANYSENNSDSNSTPINFSLAGAYKLGNLSFGLNGKITPEYSSKSNRDGLSHTNYGSYYSTDTYKDTTEDKISSSLLEAGVNYKTDLFDIDTVIGMNPSTTKNQQISNSVNGVENANINDKDFYPGTKTDTDVSYIKIRPRYKLSDDMTIGLLLNYRDQSDTMDLETKTPQSAATKYGETNKTCVFNIGTGFSITNDKKDAAGCDIIYATKYNKDIIKYGSTANTITTNDNSFIIVRVGGEKSITQKVCFRLGAEMINNITNNQTTLNVLSNKQISENISNQQTKFTAGVGYKINETLSLDYSFATGYFVDMDTLVGNGYLTINTIGVTAKF